MTNLPGRYIHGFDNLDTATPLERFAATAAEAEYHLNEALKSMKAAQAFLSSRIVADDMRQRRVDREYVFRTLDGLLDIGRELKAGHGMLMFGDGSIAPSLEIQERYDGFNPDDGQNVCAPGAAAVKGGRPTPLATTVTGAGAGGPIQLPQVHRGEDR